MKRIIDKEEKAIADLESATTLTAEEQVELGIKYFRNSSRYKNHSVAFEIFSMAAEKGSAKAMTYLSRMYHDGLYVEKDEDMSVELLKKASDLNDITAKCILAAIAKSGENPEFKPEDAVRFYTEASKLGSRFATFCLADIYKNGTITKKDYAKAIEYYSQSINAPLKSKYMGILAGSYIGLIQCFLELHYMEEANVARNIDYYNSSRTNKEKAKYYLEQASTIKDSISIKIREEYCNTLKIYASILNEDVIDISKMPYGEFRKAYYNKHPRIFLPTKKSEHLIYADGIKSYFLKRDDVEEEIEHSVMQKQAILQKRKAILKNIIPTLEISKSAEEIKQIKSDCLKEIDNSLESFKSSYLVDYSSCIINLDKYLEEILHHIFVVMLGEYKKEQLKHQINNQESLILKLINKLSYEKLESFNSVTSRVPILPEQNKIDKEKHIQLSQSFIKKLIERKFPKSLNRRISDINDKLSNPELLNKTETELYESVIMLNDIVKEHNSFKINQSFQLGELFNLTFVDNTVVDGGLDVSSQNKLKEEILNFVQTINPKLAKEEAYLKLHELILKVEHFRVMVRNVASHKSILTQKLIEKGINLCIVQESSIFNLIDELFGEYIEKQIYLQDAKNFISKTGSSTQIQTVDELISKSMDNSKCDLTILV